MDISFVILTWNSARYIKKCVNSYAKATLQDGLAAEFLIVDNGSVDHTLFEIEKNIFPKLPVNCVGMLFKLEKNYGTTRSRNIALKKARGKYIIVCDSDTEYIGGSLKRAIDFVSNDRKIGIIAPCLLLPNGEVQNSVKRFPTLIDKLNKLGKIFFKLPIDKRDFYQSFPWETVKPVDTAISACWLFPKAILDSVGYLDERIFYSPEDVDFCIRVWKSGRRIIFYPDLKIIHHTQQISHSKPLSRLSISHFLGLMYYFYKHRYLVRRPFYAD